MQQRPSIRLEASKTISFRESRSLDKRIIFLLINTPTDKNTSLESSFLCRPISENSSRGRSGGFRVVRGGSWSARNADWAALRDLWNRSGQWEEDGPRPRGLQSPGC